MKLLFVLLFLGLLTTKVDIENEPLSIDLPMQQYVESVNNSNTLDLAEVEKVYEEMVEQVLAESKACAVGTFKSYTDYRVYQNKTTPQYDLQVHPDTYTDSEGFRRHGKYYIVAVGSYYGREIGKTYHVIMENGEEFDIMIGDQKQNRHTDETNCYCLSNGSVLEFIVDTKKIGSLARKMGDVSHSRFPGNIAYIIDNKR